MKFGRRYREMKALVVLLLLLKKFTKQKKQNKTIAKYVYRYVLIFLAGHKTCNSIILMYNVSHNSSWENLHKTLELPCFFSSSSATRIISKAAV